MKTKICAVVVTYNRLEKLKKTLDAYLKQTVLPDAIVILDNNSNDGTQAYLREWEKANSMLLDIDIIYENKNNGGAGGFYKALEYAQRKEVEWIWISDDDAYPEINVFQLIHEKVDQLSLNIGAICGSVLEHGEVSLLHRRRANKSIIKGINESVVPLNEYNNDYFELNCYTFVGTCIRNDVLKEVGLPEKDYFIWYDDTEHSLRINKRYKIICIPEIRVCHDVETADKSVGIIRGKNWKAYYSNRNRLFTYQKHFSKVYFNIYFLRWNFIKAMYYFVDKRSYALKVAAVNDFKQGKLGISERYKPGAKV